MNFNVKVLMGLMWIFALPLGSAADEEIIETKAKYDSDVRMWTVLEVRKNPVITEAELPKVRMERQMGNDTLSPPVTITRSPEIGTIVATGCTAWMDGNRILYSNFHANTSSSRTCSINIPILFAQILNKIEFAHQGSYQVVRQQESDSSYSLFDYTDARLSIFYSVCGRDKKVDQVYEPYSFSSTTNGSFTYSNTFEDLECKSTEILSMEVTLSNIQNGLGFFSNPTYIELGNTTLNINQDVTSGVGSLVPPLNQLFRLIF